MEIDAQTQKYNEQENLLNIACGNLKNNRFHPSSLKQNKFYSLIYRKKNSIYL